MTTNQEDWKFHFSRVFSCFVKCKHVQERICDRLLKQYDAFLLETVQPNKCEFQDFDKKKLNVFVTF